MNMLTPKICSICGKEFLTNYPRQNICSHECRIEAQRRRVRIHLREKRNAWRDEIKKSCFVCGFNLTTDKHHEFNKIYDLCPNHHALITRGIRTIWELESEAQTKNISHERIYSPDDLG